jgi:DNA-binding NtrC family response regulator
MPELDARLALQLLQERGLSVPFIVVSGNIGEDAAVAMMQQGAADYLLKDRLVRLGPAVTRALQQNK